MRGVGPVFSQPKHSNFISAWGIVMTAIVLGGAPTPGSAQSTGFVRTQDPQYQLHIDRGPLNSALKELAVQTGLQIARFSDVGGEATIVGPVTGRYTPMEALRLILANTSLTFSVINQHTVALVPIEGSAPSSPKSPPASALPPPQSTTAPSTPPTSSRDVPAVGGRPAEARRGFFARLASIFAVCGAAAAGTVCAQEAPGAAPALSAGSGAASAAWRRSRIPLTNRLDCAVLYRLASSSSRRLVIGSAFSARSRARCAKPL